MLSPLIDGLSAPDIALAVGRAGVGVFFAISGFHKIFIPARHESLVKTLKECRVPCIGFNQWFVPIVELLAGTFLTLGFLSVLSALLLGAICLVATCTDGLRRVMHQYQPINAADFVDDVLYLPEVLYGLILLMVILAGPGSVSLDHFLRWTS